MKPQIHKQRSYNYKGRSVGKLLRAEGGAAGGGGGGGGAGRGAQYLTFDSGTAKCTL